MKKIGVDYLNSEIQIIDEIKFKLSTRIERKSKLIPTTTNHVESLHGQLNNLTSRKKSMFPQSKK